MTAVYCRAVDITDAPLPEAGRLCATTPAGLPGAHFIIECAPHL